MVHLEKIKYRTYYPYLDSKPPQADTLGSGELLTKLKLHGIQNSAFFNDKTSKPN
jgi:hypothetical protein